MTPRQTFVIFSGLFIMSLIAVLKVQWTCTSNSNSPCGQDGQDTASLIETLQHVRGHLSKELSPRGQDGQDTDFLIETLQQVRGHLSKQLNEQRKVAGRMDCEKGGNTNSVGGWCKKTSKEDSGQHATDMKLVKSLSVFLKGKKVGSFGDGPGAYKRELLKLGDVASYDAYDGAPYCEETSEGRVRFMDLTVPQYGIPMYDWVISLEVAEHIPKQYEPVYVDNIARHSREGIIISWARPGQGGLAHINNRPLSYVVDIMEHHGFSYDNSTSNMLQKASSLSWLRNNVNVFRREHLDTRVDIILKES